MKKTLIPSVAMCLGLFACGYCFWQLLVVPGFTNSGNWGPMTNNVQMSIALNGFTNQIHANHDVTLSIRIKNLSAKDIAYYDALAQNTNPEAGFGFIVISPSGKEILSNRDDRRWGGSGAFQRVPPGKTNVFEFSLSHFFRLDEIGTYKLTAKKIVYFYTNKSCEVTSNPLNVAVVP